MTMKREGEESKMDEYLKAHFARDARCEGIEPSKNFLQGTMCRVMAYERRRQRLIDGGAVLFAAFPIAARQAWLWWRNDYFSASSLPFSRIIIQIYEFLLSAVTFYGLVALALVFLSSYAMKFRHEWTSQVRRAISF